MSKDLTELFRDASELSEQDRATLAGLLIQYLERKPTPMSRKRGPRRSLGVCLRLRVSFLEAADAEVDAALAWYAERSLLAASGFLHELSKTINRIVEAPDRDPKADHGTRQAAASILGGPITRRLTSVR